MDPGFQEAKQARLPTNTPSPPQGTTAIHTRVFTEYLPTWSILTAAGHVIGPAISASRWHSGVQAILHCWRHICTASDIETLPLVDIAMELMRRQNIGCYTAQHMTRRGGSHGQISTIKAIQDAYGASWRGLGQRPVPRPGMRERESKINWLDMSERDSCRWWITASTRKFLSTWRTAAFPSLMRPVDNIFVPPVVITWLYRDTISARMVVGHSPGTHCAIQCLALTVSDICLKLVCIQSTYRALEALHIMQYALYKFTI